MFNVRFIDVVIQFFEDQKQTRQFYTL